MQYPQMYTTGIVLYSSVILILGGFTRFRQGYFTSTRASYLSIYNRQRLFS